MNNWVEISQPHLAMNYRTVSAAAGPQTEVLAVVKAGGYGHGVGLCAATLAETGARWLGVTCATEGIVARRAAGPEARLLLMCGFLPEDVEAIEQHHLTPVVWTAEQVDWLRAGRVHVEIDTGMGRQGVRSGRELALLLDRIADTELEVEGVFTHFCSSEETGSELTQRQQRLFAEAVAQVNTAGLRPGWVHAGNSSTVDNPAQGWPWLVDLATIVGARAMVRVGLALYGYCLPVSGGESRLRPALLPVFTWKAHVLAVRALTVGDTVGYNATFTADRPMRVATLAVGYADGLRRELSSRGWVMLHGQPAPIVGRISMNLTVVDVTEIDGVRAGDAAVVLGEGVTADDHARLAGTIAYEILCGIHPCG